MTIRLPLGLDELNFIVGADFPDADEEALWRLAAAWDRAAFDLRRLQPDAARLRSEVTAALDGDTAAAFGARWDLIAADPAGFIETLAAACDQLSAACHDAGTEVEYAKLQYIAALVALGITLAGLVAALALGGVSAAGVPIAIAATQLTIRVLLTRLLTAMVLGAAANVAIDAVAQGIQVNAGHRGSWDWSKTARAAGDGALYGAIGGGIFMGVSRLAPGALTTAGGLLASAGGTGLVGGITVPLLHGETPTAEDVFTAVVSGAAGALGPQLRPGHGRFEIDAAEVGAASLALRELGPSGPADALEPGANGAYGWSPGIATKDALGGSPADVAGADGGYLAGQTFAPERPMADPGRVPEAPVRPPAPGEAGPPGGVGVDRPAVGGLIGGAGGPGTPAAPAAPGAPSPSPGVPAGSPGSGIGSSAGQPSTGRTVPGGGVDPAAGQSGTGPGAPGSSGSAAVGSGAVGSGGGSGQAGGGGPAGGSSPTAGSGVQSAAPALGGSGVIGSAMTVGGGPLAGPPPGGHPGTHPGGSADQAGDLAGRDDASPDPGSPPTGPPVLSDADVIDLVRRSVFTTDAGLAFYPVGDEVRPFAENVHPTEGFVTLDLHGSPDGFHIEDHRLSPRQFALALRELMTDATLVIPDGSGIKLLSCDTARGGDSSAAAALARELGVDIIAPDHPVWTAMDGQEIVSSPMAFGGVLVPKYPPDGSWHRFSGGGIELPLDFDPGYHGDNVQSLLDNGVAGGPADRGFMIRDDLARPEAVDAAGTVTDSGPDSGAGPGAGIDTANPGLLSGLDPADVIAQIPPSWTQRPSGSGDGVVFADPDRAGHQIRIMPGYPSGSRPDPITAGPYAVISANGHRWKVPLMGNPTLGGDQ